MKITVIAHFFVAKIGPQKNAIFVKKIGQYARSRSYIFESTQSDFTKFDFAKH